GAAPPMWPCAEMAAVAPPRHGLCLKTHFRNSAQHISRQNIAPRRGLTKPRLLAGLRCFLHLGGGDPGGAFLLPPRPRCAKPRNGKGYGPEGRHGRRFKDWKSAREAARRHCHPCL